MNISLCRNETLKYCRIEIIGNSMCQLILELAVFI